MLHRLLRKCLPCTDSGDAFYAFCMFLYSHRRLPQRRNPTYFTDHLYKMKTEGALKHRLRIMCTDKENVKGYIAGAVGQEHVAQTYQVLRDADALDGLVLDRLPCVIKPTHLSGHIEFHFDATQPLRLDVLKRWFEMDYYKMTREQNYRGLRPGIIVEEFISEDGRTIPDDYKVFCFNGVPKLIYVDSGRLSKNRTQDIYDTDWCRQPITFSYPGASCAHPKPTQLEKMLDLAARCSKPFTFVRVDMLVAGEIVRVGELTPCPGSANERIDPPAAQVTLGKLWKSS